MPHDLAELAVGDRWAYRQRKKDPATCVEVLRLGTSKPPRVLVKFEGDEHEGRQEWVPPGRLKVPWADVDEWQAKEQRWSALREASEYIRGSTEDHALSMIFDNMPAWEHGRYLYNDDAGILLIHDVDAVAANLGLDREFIESEPTSFIEDGSLVVPWRVTQEIVQRLARKHADVLVPKIMADEDEAREHNRWGYMGGHGHISAEICAETDKEFAPARELALQWCGAEARERYDELQALRVEVVRLGKLIERAINLVRKGANAREADALERELGIPLEVLRHAGEDRRSRYGP